MYKVKVSRRHALISNLRSSEHLKPSIGLITNFNIYSCISRLWVFTCHNKLSWTEIWNQNIIQKTGGEYKIPLMLLLKADQITY